MPIRRFFAALIALAWCTGVLANEVQFHICAAGQNLGEAYARTQYFNGEIGPDQSAEVAGNLANAAAHIAAAEAGVQQPFYTQPERERSIAELQRKIAAYADRAPRFSPNARMEIIQGFYTHYRNALSLSYASNRNTPFQWNPTCDSRMLDANWHLGRAATYAAVRFDRSTVHETQARSAQSGANGSAYRAIREGLQRALDGSGPTPVEHCYFNTEEAWSIVPMLRPDEPHTTYVSLLPRVLEVCRGAGPDHPPGHRACHDYASTAVEQTRKARNAGCQGIQGPRWDSTYQDHYGWCITVSQAARNAETEGRAQTLRACGALGADPACHDYASTAVEQTRKARSAGCQGIHGPRWDSTYQDHHGWCITVSQAARDAETGARAQTLRACGVP